MTQVNLFTKQKQSHKFRKQTCGYQGVRGGGEDWKIEIDTHTLLYMYKMVTNKDLLTAQGTLLSAMQWPMWETTLRKDGQT